jgi:hypothetical protein
MSAASALAALCHVQGPVAVCTAAQTATPRLWGLLLTCCVLVARLCAVTGLALTLSTQGFAASRTRRRRPSSRRLLWLLTP